MTISTKISRSTVFAGALALASLPGCLGGDGEILPDASGSNGNGNGNGNGADAAPLTCEDVMLDAPTGDDAPSFRDALPTATLNTWDGATIPGTDEEDYPGGKYRTLEEDAEGAIHPGCSTDDLGYEPADIEGYPCAAKEYPFPDSVSEDTSKPIVLLIHGNSDSPAGWESFLHPSPEDWMDDEARDQLAERLPAAGYRTIAVDTRTLARNDDPPENESRNVDHGWSVPIAQAFIRAVIENNPDREIAIVGFSLGATVTRDALRRLWVEWYDDESTLNPFEHVSRVIVTSGGHHGVSTYAAYCDGDMTMQRTAACELGQRGAYTPVEFHEPLNGPRIDAESEWGGWYETPCADGDYAYGQRGVCGGNTIAYTTIAMEDNDDGTQQDAIVSEHASRLYPSACVNNVINPQSAFDTSGYFANGLLRNHYGSVRSDTGIQVVLGALAE